MNADAEQAVTAMFRDFDTDALEENQGVPTQPVIAELRRIVTAMYRRWPTEYDVYAMDRQTAAVEVNRGPGQGALLLICEPRHEALCVITIKSVSRRARYQDSAMLPDGFIADGMRDIGISETPHPTGP